MLMSEPRTASMFNHCDIDSNDDKREAMLGTEAHLAAIPA
jgi:hypothetical protein